MQSADYVPGISGWKIEKGLIEMNGGPHGSVRIGDIEKQHESPASEQLAAPWLAKQDLGEPFIVVDGVTYINGALLDQAATKVRSADEELAVALADWKVGPAQFLVSAERFAVKMARNGNGDYVCAGIGLGLSEFEQAKAKGADAVLDYIGDAICNTQLGQGLKSRTNELSELIRQVIRQELRPGGLLHRR
ncbi:hypothetical protein [Pseudomonas putida]|uniref:hypothetical protein n=1 Tax=Pseudomonas putida TaxID=303 RepID=UPI002365A4C3|nr:hypothetical protein [Pseudomonas putida]MDD2046103.1 hypothetical protein [Pseudomonas putida]